MSERFVILGLGQARSSWFTDSCAHGEQRRAPLELVKCVSHEEARVRLASGRAFSALLVDGGLPGVDRDLIDAARRAGVEVLVVDDPRVSRDWDALGATDVLSPSFGVADLLASLSALTQAIPRSIAGPVLPASTPRLWSGDLIAVTGAGGTGVSTIAAALAQGLAARQGRRGAVLLADLALDADQGVLHHAPDVVPGLPELVEAHRAGSLRLCGAFDGVRRRGARLPPVARAPATTGGRRCGRRALEAALDSLLAAYPIVVADVDPDVDGHHECGSFEVEERDAVAGTTLARATATVVVGSATIGGLHSLAEVLRDLCEHGVDPRRIVPVVNHAPRAPRQRAAIARALPMLGGSATFGDEPRPRRAGVRACPARRGGRRERRTSASRARRDAGDARGRRAARGPRADRRPHRAAGTHHPRQPRTLVRHGSGRAV